MADVDYGYGDNTTDYGYGDSAPDSTDYGYGDSGAGAAEATDYGYGDDSGAPQEPTPQPKGRRPRRRCSVTKYSLEEASKDSGTPEAEMVQQLNAAQMMQHFRNGGAPGSAPGQS